MSKLLEFFNDMRDNGYGLAEIAAQLGTSAIAEPVAGFAAMYDPANGADAIREGMTYQPRSEAAKMYQQGASNVVGQAIKPVMPVIDAWQKGVDIAGKYSPSFGALLKTVPTAIGVTLGAKPALQTGRNMSKGLEKVQSRMVANATAPRTLNTGYMGQRGTFAGINALTADKEALDKAQQMIAQGVDPEDVWQQTGWGKGVDGKWRFEIDDSNAQFTNDAIKELRNKNGKRLGDIFPHQELSAAYPESSDIWTVKQSGDGASYRGGEMGKSDMISLGIPKRGAPDISELKRTNLHEIQHAIQDKEGFATGGNPEQFKNLFSKEQLQDARILAGFMRKGKSLEDALQEYKTLIRREPVSGALTLVRHNSDPDYLNAMTHDPNEAYRRLAGEVEARTTESRVNLNAQQRRDNYPFDYKTHGYDVPANYQNVEFDSKNAISQRPLTEFEQAHLTAQRNAALPVEKGGLGLPADNTAMDRARAMGWADDGYHGTSSDFPEFSLGGYGVHGNVGGTGVYLGVPDMASSYAQSASSLTGKPANVMPLLTRGKLLDTNSEAPLNNNLIDKYINENLHDGDKARIALDAGGKRTTRTFENIEDAKDFFWNQKKNWEAFGGFDRTLPKADMIDGKPVVSYVDFNAPVSLNGLPTKEVHEALRRAGGGTMTDVLKNIGYDGTKSARETVIFDPKNIRSRFAAFDPFNRESSNLLATTAPLVPTTALGAYMYNEKRKKSQGNQ